MITTSSEFYRDLPRGKENAERSIQMVKEAYTEVYPESSERMSDQELEVVVERICELAAFIWELAEVENPLPQVEADHSDARSLTSTPADKRAK